MKTTTSTSLLTLAQICVLVVLIFAEPTVERGRTISRISVAKGSNLNFRGRKSNSLMNLCGKAPSHTLQKQNNNHHPQQEMIILSPFICLVSGFLLHNTQFGAFVLYISWGYFSIYLLFYIF